MSFTAIQTRLDSDGVVILDGGTGTENPRVGGSNPPLGTIKIKELSKITTHTESLLATI